MRRFMGETKSKAEQIEKKTRFLAKFQNDGIEMLKVYARFRIQLIPKNSVLVWNPSFSIPFVRAVRRLKPANQPANRASERASERAASTVARVHR